MIKNIIKKLNLYFSIRKDISWYIDKSYRLGEIDFKTNTRQDKYKPIENALRLGKPVVDAIYDIFQMDSIAKREEDISLLTLNYIQDILSEPNTKYQKSDITKGLLRYVGNKIRKRDRYCLIDDFVDKHPYITVGYNVDYNEMYHWCNQNDRMKDLRYIEKRWKEIYPSRLDRLREMPLRIYFKVCTADILQFHSISAFSVVDPILAVVDIKSGKGAYIGLNGGSILISQYSRSEQKLSETMRPDYCNSIKRGNLVIDHAQDLCFTSDIAKRDFCKNTYFRVIL